MAETLVRSLAELKQFYTSRGEPCEVLELMGQDNSVNDDIPYMEANESDGHRSTIRSKLPDIYYGRLYRGTPNSKSGVSSVKDICARFEGRNEIDVRELQLFADRAAVYRAGESRAFTEAMNQKHATDIFYGDNATNPDQFFGLSPRYPAKNSPNVVDAGGSGSSCTSMWGVVWGQDDVHGIYPKNTKGGLSVRTLPEYDAQDENGNKYRVVGDLFEWNTGLTVRDWRSVVRVCNIDASKLELRKGDAGFIDLHRLTIKAKNMIPTGKRGRMIWYCNSDVMTALEYQATDAGNVQLVYGELFDSKGVPFIHTRPVRQCDAILSTETALAAA